MIYYSNDILFAADGGLIRPYNRVPVNGGCPDYRASPHGKLYYPGTATCCGGGLQVYDGYYKTVPFYLLTRKSDHIGATGVHQNNITHRFINL